MMIFEVSLYIFMNVFSMSKLDENQKKQLADAYAPCSLTVDRLPFTPEFDRIYEPFSDVVTKNELFLTLANMRKRKELPRKAR